MPWGAGRAADVGVAVGAAVGAAAGGGAADIVAAAGAPERLLPWMISHRRRSRGAPAGTTAIVATAGVLTGLLP